MRAHVLFFLLAATLSAQPLTIGAKLGVPFTNGTGSGDESRPWAAGPSVEVRLPAGFAVEASAIYRRIGQTFLFNFTTGANSSALLSDRMRGNAWEFPVLAKYYLRRPKSGWQPYLGAGWAFRTVGYRFDGNTVASFTDSYQYTIDQLIERIIDRCRELNLRLSESEESTKSDFMVFLTVQTMNYLHSGRHRVAL